MCHSLFYQADCSVSTRETLLGSLVPKDNSISFYLTNQGSGDSRVSSYGERGEIIFNNMLNSQENMLRLKDISGINFVDEPKESDLDLSPQNLTKDKILQLF